MLPEFLDGFTGAPSQRGLRHTRWFQYQGGHISQLVCDCYCTLPLQTSGGHAPSVRDTLKHIDRHYADAYAQSGYFAAIGKSAFFSFAIDGRASGTFTFEQGAVTCRHSALRFDLLSLPPHQVIDRLRAVVVGCDGADVGVFPVLGVGAEGASGVVPLVFPGVYTARLRVPDAHVAGGAGR